MVGGVRATVLLPCLLDEKIYLKGLLLDSMELLFCFVYLPETSPALGWAQAVSMSLGTGPRQSFRLRS
ncbi:unnamed protein product [Haemonchus placei]|uniref:Secreted protein n=1 Tax=Haemonchus placei TaxID=6290 RepID=A0A0N4WND6_HAEPC|nr:unnamed protein product [Haemonchus placei]